MPGSDEKEEIDHADCVSERQLHDCGQAGIPDLRILHFNDVYHPHPSDEEPKGGAARFKTMCDYYRNDPSFKDHPTPFTLFSGDALNPSKESSVTKGSHMIPVLNEIGIDAACVGNHEFDFGAAHFAYLARDCNFPWLLSNIFDPDLGGKMPLGRCRQTLMLQASKGIKVGLMGLVEKEWTEKINSSLPSDIEYFDMKDTAKRMAPELRAQGADIVIAITHARQERDFDFCENIPAGLIDIVLAGHDHWVEHKLFPNGTVLIRSGYDFNNVTHTEGFRQDGSWKFNTVRRNLTGDVEEDKSMKAITDQNIEAIHREMGRPVGYTAVPLEARKEICQTQESNYGNFLADLMRTFYHADCALINGGTFYGDTVYQAGQLLVKDIVDCFPFEDPVVVLKVSGSAIKDALENGVRKYPEPESRFPQVSNILFTFDPSANPGNRVKDIKVGGKDLSPQKEYSIATRSHLAAGKAGYESLKSRRDGGDAVEIIDEENGVLVSTLVRQYFTWINVVDAFKGLSGGEESKVSHRKHVLSALHAPRWKSEEERLEMVKRRVVRRWKEATFVNRDVEGMMKYGEGPFFPGWSRGIMPALEGRSQVLRNSHG